ncbi:lysophospholipid acyltransferase family protein [Cellvibrio japonicus]|uniref:Uvs118 n=1 Tax=Cellvibrio japonicus (strain Ueda107) TaxID=498211 RepID=B3PFD8_CELJU|nr:lysophospholipid acyltransferase family protein [Cellvibrio japonicus]ACE82716.1 Uvs118 [Cellvibrio japonicus Ueda107]QEI10811.1 1-acyl-sn-glycerol-3-phosphate acyltransferase [Cellvibrio japonicus]QEI14387.1 1-acyl-sn-glycerol-3-phosphate acyltransferase [Cellvibrio japonicus]QEI17965.1 1-acyl-sn-glycerol-3-phosphate acyltransferase [Cellvibrio japonicus]
MLTLRSLIFTLGYNISGAFAGLIAVIIWPILPYSWRWQIVTCWNRFVMFWLRLCCGIRIEIIGEKHRDQYPCVVMAKHQSTWETMFLQYYFGPVSTILKKELLRIPFFGWGLASLRPIAIDRSNPVQALKDIKRKGIQRLQQGNNLLIFPEGTRIPVGKAGNYARSGADIAISAGVPIIAVAHNAGEYWPHKHLIKYPGTVRIVISEPITTEGKDRKQLTDDIKNWIEGEIAKMPPVRRNG